jgi:uncharacterized membrane protein YqgA involved in biofilm formation
VHLPLGTLVNIAAVVVGSLAGMWLHRGFPERFRRILLTAGGLATLALGAQMAVKAGNPLVLIGSLYIGALLGEALGIEAWLERLGERPGRAGALAGEDDASTSESASSDANKDEHENASLTLGNLTGEAPALPGKFTTGLVTAFLIFCVGPMTILGALSEGIGGPEAHSLLYVKSVLDLVTSFALASSFGSGVLFSAVPLAVFQLAITGVGLLVGKSITDDIITELTAVGGALIIGLGLNLLGIARLKVANLLPALLMVIMLMVLLKYVPYLF